ncbi:unnamed protein product [Arabis nemorensis]|uniref:Uncharacterized protein n=1 Tax=Arabis nemorensis TaxID=586526 RepID=A0A565C7M2_9BRAS|nr:unnamed protein product [Arabis nemorensis]
MQVEDKGHGMGKGGGRREKDPWWTELGRYGAWDVKGWDAGRWHPVEATIKANTGRSTGHCA